MKKLINQAEFDLLQNEFIINQQQVKSIISSYKLQRNIAFILLVVIIVGSFATVFMSMQIASEAKKVDKLVYREDGSGGLVYMGLPVNKLNINATNYVREQLKEYITALYSIPSDMNQRQHFVSKVQFMTASNYYHAYPQPTLKEAYTKQSHLLVTVKVETVGQVSTGVWEVDFKKFINGNLAGTYKSLITFSHVDISGGDTQLAVYNPLGIAVTNITTVDRMIAQ